MSSHAQILTAPINATATIIRCLWHLFRVEINGIIALEISQSLRYVVVKYANDFTVVKYHWVFPFTFAHAFNVISGTTNCLWCQQCKREHIARHVPRCHYCTAIAAMSLGEASVLWTTMLSLHTREQ